MAAKKQSKEKGVFFALNGRKFGAKLITERVVELRRGNVVTGTEVEKLDAPYWTMFEPTKPQVQSISVRGSIVDLNGNADPSTFAGRAGIIVDGEIIDIALEPGLTGSEGKRTKKGAIAKRNQKLSGSTLVTIDGVVHQVQIGVSQPKPYKLYMWGKATPVVESKTRQRQAPAAGEDLSPLESVGEAL